MSCPEKCPDYTTDPEEYDRQNYNYLDRRHFNVSKHPIHCTKPLGNLKQYSQPHRMYRDQNGQPIVTSATNKKTRPNIYLDRYVWQNDSTWIDCPNNHKTIILENGDYVCANNQTETVCMPPITSDTTLYNNKISNCRDTNHSIDGPSFENPQKCLEWCQKDMDCKSIVTAITTKGSNKCYYYKNNLSDEEFFEKTGGKVYGVVDPNFYNENPFESTDRHNADPLILKNNYTSRNTCLNPYDSNCRVPGGEESNNRCGNYTNLPGRYSYFSSDKIGDLIQEEHGPCYTKTAEYILDNGVNNDMSEEDIEKQDIEIDLTYKDDTNIDSESGDSFMDKYPSTGACEGHGSQRIVMNTEDTSESTAETEENAEETDKTSNNTGFKYVFNNNQILEAFSEQNIGADIPNNTINGVLTLMVILCVLFMFIATKTKGFNILLNGKIFNNIKSLKKRLTSLVFK